MLSKTSESEGHMLQWNVVQQYKKVYLLYVQFVQMLASHVKSGVILAEERRFNVKKQPGPKRDALIAGCLY